MRRNGRDGSFGGKCDENDNLFRKREHRYGKRSKRMDYHYVERPRIDFIESYCLTK